jgi:hypothetical protein
MFETTIKDEKWKMKNCYGWGDCINWEE